MKIYNLNIDTSKPTNQVVQMQQGTTGMLSVNVTNDGKYIRNLSCTLYDGTNEIEATTSADTSFGFKVEVGTEPKHVKVEAKSILIESQYTYVANMGTGSRVKQVWCDKIRIPAGTYHQDEFESLKRFGNYSGMQVVFTPSEGGQANFDRIQIILLNPAKQLFFGKTQADNSIRWFSPDELLVVSEEIQFGTLNTVRMSGYVLSTDTYPAIGYYTDYQLDTLVKPSDNAPYDGNYVEPLEEIEVDGVKFVPTTLSVDGVEYKVLAEAQPAPEPEEPTTNEGE